MMEQPIFLKEFNLLPPHIRHEVIDFISFLYTRYVSEKDQSSLSSPSISNDPVFGMWKDREDMKDSREWLRNVREKQWASKNE
ncbi:MAG: DUF2281 domain-containing protein [Desulfobacterales bacterium]|nr:DUF2281 domain-containing protein [Desulfobacterales bacterium]